MAIFCCHNGSLNVCLAVLPAKLARGKDECKSMTDGKRKAEVLGNKVKEESSRRREERGTNMPVFSSKSFQNL